MTLYMHNIVSLVPVLEARSIIRWMFFDWKTPESVIAESKCKLLHENKHCATASCEIHNFRDFIGHTVDFISNKGENDNLCKLQASVSPNAMRKRHAELIVNISWWVIYVLDQDLWIIHIFSNILIYVLVIWHQL